MPNDEVSLSAHINIFALYATGNRLFVVLGVAAARPAWSRPLICKGTSRSRVHGALTKPIAVFRAYLVSNKSPTYKLKSEKSDLFCQTPPTYKSPLLISFKLVYPCLKLISHPFSRRAHTFNELISYLQPNKHNL